jgi:hypothetical membrane protein
MVTRRLDSGQRRLLAPSGAVLWIGAALTYLLLEAIAASAVVPAYSYATNYISALGVPAWSPRAAVMNTAFYLQGILFLAGGVLVARAAGQRAVLFVGFAAANAVGNILVGGVHSVNRAAGDGPGWHFVGAALAIVGGNAAIVAGSSVLTRAGAPWAYRAVSVALAVVGFLCLAAVGVNTSHARLPIGAWERGSVYSILVWQLFTGVYLLAGPVRRTGAAALYSRAAPFGAPDHTQVGER